MGELADDVVLLEQYLDASLDEAGRARFEQRLAAEPALRAQLALQQRIDDSLARLFHRAGTAHDAQPAGLTHVSGRAAATAPRRRSLALAAAVALLLSAGWLAQLTFDGSAAPVRRLYERQVAAGFQPQFVCADDDAFRQWTAERYGQELVPAATRDAIELVGWVYAPMLSSYSAALLARADSTPVVVLMDRLERDRPLEAPGGGLHLFRRAIGTLVLYEVTPLDRPVVLDVLSAPGRP